MTDVDEVEKADGKLAEGGEGPPPVSRWLATRIAVLVGVLACEYLLLAIAFDASRLLAMDGLWSGLGQIKHVVGFAIATLAASVILQGQRLVTALEVALADRPSFSVVASLVHAGTFALFVLLSSQIFASNALESNQAATWFVAWLACGALTTLTWLRAALGSKWLASARAASPALATGLLVGGLAYLGTWASRPWWPALVDQTLPWVRRLLVLSFGAGRVSGSGDSLGLDGFHVVVAPECSGVEGLLVVTVLIGSYLLVRRERLRFPQALLLLPIGMASAYMLNGLRIVTLVWIGATFSPAIALGGFHSRAGWLAVCFVAVATLWAGERTRLFARHAGVEGRGDNPVLFYCLPLLVSVALQMVTGLAAASSLDWLYFVHVCGAAGVLWAFRRRLLALGRPAFGWATLHGIAVFGLWYLLADRGSSEATTELLGELFSAPNARRQAWVFARVIGSVAVVPVVEELAFRGYLQRRLISADFTEVPQSRYTLPSLLVSALAFGAVHQSLAAGAVAGLAFSGATYVRGRLIDAIWSHAVANALVAAAVLAGGAWWLW